MRDLNPFLAAGGGVLGYLLVTFALYKIALNLGHDLPWLAFIPIANVWLVLDLGGQPGWTVLLLFVPCINIVELVIVFMAWADICRRHDMSGICALLLLVPLVNLIFVYYLAYSSPRYRHA